MGNQLSGGEQQMLAIGRALMTNPHLLIPDEATRGLARLIRQEIWNCLSMLKARGQSILMIDKNVDHLTPICDRHYIIERGRAVRCGTTEQLIAEPELRHRYLGVWEVDSSLRRLTAEPEGRSGRQRFCDGPSPRAATFADIVTAT